MPLTNSWERFYTAVHILCGPGTQSERLTRAISESLIHISPEVDLPEEMGFAFMTFMEEMNPDTDGATIQAMVEALGDDAQSKAAEKILEFYEAIWRYRKAD